MHKRNKLALASALAFTMAAATASAVTVKLQPAGGHPWNTGSRSNWDVFDGTVGLGGTTHRIWITFFQLPTTATTVSGTWTGYTGSAGYTKGRLCTFDGDNGAVVGCTSWATNGNMGSTGIPSGGSAFAQFEMWGGGWVAQVNVTY